MIKAVIFDMDGVLVDSMPYHADAWVSVFKDVGINIRRKDIYDIEGSNYTGIINLVFKKLGERQSHRITSCLHRKNRKYFQRSIR